jgi:hypothetical protein
LTKRSLEKLSSTLAGSSKTRANGWLRVHLHGNPDQVGFQHGYHLAPELDKTITLARNYAQTNCNRDWKFFRKAATKMYEPSVPNEYLEEITGITRGAQARGVRKIDETDILALNGLFDTLFYHSWLRYQEQGTLTPVKGAGHCSAFIATGAATKDRGLVLAHNMWLGYDLAVWNVILSIHPEKGQDMLMQTLPGSIQGCGVDVYVNSAGLMVTNTTLSGVKTFNSDGTPYFVRARKAIQYAKSMDEWINIVTKNNNGGNASGWLIGDAKTNEAGYLELGTFNHAAHRTKDGFFMGCNAAYDPKVQSETCIDYNNTSSSSATRNTRWKQLMETNRGTIDVEAAKEFLADHNDTFLNVNKPTSGTICGHVELDPRGWPEWNCGPYYPGGTTDGIVTNSNLTKRGEFWAHWGKPCGTDFIASKFFKNHPEYSQLAPNTHDLISHPWTLFSLQ